MEDGETQHTYEATIVARGANRARIDGGKSQYMRDLIGRTPSVSFTPEDQRLVAGDPATRRNFINQAASLLLPHYAQTLQQFTHVAKQRTALLKQLGDGTNLDPQYGQQAVLSGLEIWTGQFIDLGMQLTRDRNNVISRLEEPFVRIYASLAGDDERAALAYEPSFDEVMLFDDPAAEISRISNASTRRSGAWAESDRSASRRPDFAAQRYERTRIRVQREMWTMALAFENGAI